MRGAVLVACGLLVGGADGGCRRGGGASGAGDPAAADRPPTGIADDEQVVLFPTAARREGGAWTVEVHGWIHEPERRRVRLALLRKLLPDPAPDDARADTLFAERAAPLLADNERGKRVAVACCGVRATMPESGADGHSHGSLGGPAAAAAGCARDGRVVLRATARDGRAFVGEAHLCEPDGLSVVSDIDDTVKVTEVRDRKELLRNTFYRPFRAVPGMADAYRALAARGARLHYLSASPWQLYPALSSFLRDAGFPPGAWHLRAIRVAGTGALRFLEPSDAYKRDSLAALLARFPGRRFLLIGDSGERDPEVYAGVARAHPGQVARILIRDVTGDPPDGARYRAAFAGLPPDSWTVFSDPAIVAAAAP